VFTPTDFVDVGTRAAVDQALFRLTRRGTIRRLGRGLYDYPRRHARLGLLSPTPDDVARAVARRTGQSLQISGAQAANVLGLSTQVPARPVYVTDGPSRAIRVGLQTVQLRHARRFVGARGASQVVLRALNHLGKDRVTKDVVSQLRTRLSPTDKQALARDVRYASAWMQPVIDQVARQS
jgi:predicted transcriptional regulator of viral defense system